MKIVFQKADLDTCLAGAILGVTAGDELVYRLEGATADELADATVLCIEAGGSGETELGNFDHHNTSMPLSPAATQAHHWRKRPAEYERLVEYTEFVDLGQRFTEPGFPSVSNLISGIRFVHSSNPIEQFRCGLEELRKIAELGLDPFTALPSRPEWSPYFDEKRRRTDLLDAEMRGATLSRVGALTIGYSETTAIGVPGRLYRMGANIAIVRHSSFGNPPVVKYTISGDGVRVDGLLPFLRNMEPGWGGPAHGTIIGSPRTGSRLPLTRIRAVVEAHVADLMRVSIAELRHAERA